MIRRLFAAALLTGCALGLAASVQAQSSPNACPRPDRDKTYSNVPYVPTTCWTTDHGPAAADVVLVFGQGPPTQSPNMLECPSAPYALCFFLGADGENRHQSRQFAAALRGRLHRRHGEVLLRLFPGRRQLRRHERHPEPERLERDGGGLRENSASTAATSRIRACAPLLRPRWGDCKIAPVCKYIREQNPTDASKSLIPGAATISDFSLALKADYNMLKSTPCPSGRYAGCMTAACRFPGGKTP